MNYLGIEINPKELNIFGESTLPAVAWEVSDNLYAIRTRVNRDSGQRKFCRCIASKDIGQYDTCPHGCLYCYAKTIPEQGDPRLMMGRGSPVN